MLEGSPNTDILEYETKHVHDVYQDIASHFSATRYKVRTKEGMSRHELR